MLKVEVVGVKQVQPAIVKSGRRKSLEVLLVSVNASDVDRGCLHCWRYQW